MKVLTATTFIKIVLVRLRQATLSVVVLSAGILLGAPIASAQQSGTGVNEAIQYANYLCMQDATPFNLGCTANDIQVAGVATLPNGEPDLAILDDGCAFPGDTVTFMATFEVLTTAKRRHDIGI